MILTVTLNPSIDRRYVVDNFEIEGIFRAKEVQYTPGGKGINVSKVARDLDNEVMATGFLGGTSGEFIKESLEERSIKNKFVQIDDETRSCIAILSDDGGQTEVLEPGPEIHRDELERFYSNYKILLDSCDIVCASGSLPRGVPTDIYKELIELASIKGKRFILDTSQDALKEGIKASPFLIKPNRQELEAILGTPINTDHELINAIKGIGEYDIGIIVVSLGSEGSLVCCGDKIYKISIPKVKAVNPVGSGDSMIAGFAVALERSYDFETMLRFATACGTANAMEKETGKVNIDNVRRIMKEIRVERLKY